MRRQGRLLGFTAALLVAASTTSTSDAQTSPAAGDPSPPSGKSVSITFVPPPLDGTISLGIYDGKGKLVRVLHREADTDEFEIATDGLKTRWDGNDDSGQPLPAARYHARGFVVGDLEVEGIGFHFNDWVTGDQTERVERICAITAEDGGLLASARLSSGKVETIVCDSDGSVSGTRDTSEAVNCDPLDSSAATTPVRGRENSRWEIRKSADTHLLEVRQYSATDELLRSLKIAPEDPQPRRIAASPTADRIYLLEDNENVQRLRSLTLLATTTEADQAKSAWKVDFEKKIVRHKDFGIVDGTPVVGGGQPPAAKINVKLRANPLQKNEKAAADVAVGYDADGSYLQTADGLPLQTISETPRLTRVVLVRHSEKALDVFQDDTAVVEQFRLTGVDAMMAFDCGEIELK